MNKNLFVLGRDIADVSVFWSCLFETELVGLLVVLCQEKVL